MYVGDIHRFFNMYISTWNWCLTPKKQAFNTWQKIRFGKSSPPPNPCCFQPARLVWEFGGPGRSGETRWERLPELGCREQPLESLASCGFSKVMFYVSGWWFQIFFLFIPIWGRFPFWLAYFSDGLKPPPSDVLRIFIMGFRIHHTCFTSNLGKMFLFFHVFPTTLFCFFWWKDVFDLEFCCNETSDQTPTWPTITSIFLLDLCFGNRKISVSHHYWPI